MSEVMSFPETFDEFADQYKIVDKQEVYTNGTELIPIFRVKQWLDHSKLKNIKLTKEMKKNMHESKYEVLIEGVVIASGMNIQTAAVLVKALFNEYYNDHSMTISIREMERTEGVCDNGTK